MVGRLRQLYGELRRRRVFRVAAVYAAVAFIIAQGADIFFPGLQLPPWSLTLVLAFLLMGFPLAIALAWVFDVTPHGVVRTAPVVGVAPPAGDLPAIATTPANAIAKPLEPPAPERSVAVLPFVNMSSDPEQEFFSDGITEELLNVLAQVPDLRVPARTSAFAFKGRNVPVEEVARTLRVAHVLEGSVRKGGGRVRITAQLIEAGSGYHLWSESYDREISDIFAVQDEIACEIATVLRCHLLGEASPRPTPTTSVEAHNLYLKGRFYLNKLDHESLQKALEHYEAALEADPDFAMAHVGRAEALAFFADAAVAPLEILPQVREACRRALVLDPDLAEAHAVVAASEFNWGWDWENGRRALERALDLNPNSASAHMYAGMYHWMRGRYSEAIDRLGSAQRLDPLSPIVSFFLEVVHLWAGDYDAAIAQHEVTQELAPGFVYHDAWVGEAYREKGMYDEAIAAFRSGEAGLGRPSTGLAVTLARLGRIDEAEDIIRELERRADNGQYIPPEFIAHVYVALDRLDDAFRWLDRGVEARSAMALCLYTWREFAPLRGDPRYDRLLDRIGLE